MAKTEVAKNAAVDKKKADKLAEEEKKPKFVIQRYRDRLSLLRQGQECIQKEDIPRAVQFYMKYLDTLAKYFGVEENQLSPTHFDQELGLAEILLVSQVYWDLAKAYDRNPKLHKESERCLEQFVRFSLGFKFQYINSEILRKYIRKQCAYNPKSFVIAYEKIRVNSKTCYIATYCYGESHPTTETLRIFKSLLLKYKIGHHFVDIYYRLSPPFVNFCENHNLLGKSFKIILFRPILGLIAKTVRLLVT